MNKRLLVIVFCLLTSLLHSQSQDTLVYPNRDSLERLYLDIPAFSMFGDNYFVTGTTIDESPSSENSDAKFEIGFKQRLTSKILPFNTYLFFTYRQKAFWDIYLESFPFRELNYNPTIALLKPLIKGGELYGQLIISLEHESNGRDGENSRAWNYFAVGYSAFLRDNLSLSTKVWAPIGSYRDNPDLIDFRGNGYLELSLKVSRDFIVEAKRNQSIGDGWRGSTQLGLNYRISDKIDQFVYLQYYGGYAEDLIEYDRKKQMIRLGVTFKDLFLKFRK